MADFDVICLQEAPPQLPQWLPAGVFHVSELVPSHCLNSCVLLRASLFSNGVRMAALSLSAMGAIGVTTTHLPTQTTLDIVSMHNVPFKEGADDRLANMKSLAYQLTLHAKSASNVAAAIVAGDFNMRQAENKVGWD
jgi:endonuclease/exonuclease/phosphatase family metal-dependent hydrolase